jgi:glycosyltransferase involved in cell wall biosynthesis
MRTYWTAHRLAALGHEVHVLTNAKEVGPAFRMYMRAEDWRRCEAVCGAGSVTAHWTDPVDASQSYIPMASPFVSKLASIAARLHSQGPFDVIYTHYLEPYGIAGYLAAHMTGAPQVVRMAGSDAGRLWHHSQFEALYDHVLRSAEVVIAGGAVAKRAIEHGVDPDRIAAVAGFLVPEDVFTPVGPTLDLPALRSEVAADPDFRDLLWGNFAGDRPYFGICGKLGETKGSFALLAAMHRLKQAGLEIGLVALAHGALGVERRFRAQAQELGLADRILQIPFLPHWRVPEFLRSCVAVCCLEQNFPIGFHMPMIPREVLLCGTCLIGSIEVIRKLPHHTRLPDGYGCVAIDDVNNIEALSKRLAAIVRDPAPAASVGARGRNFACELQRGQPVLQGLEHILEAAATRQRVPPAMRAPADSATHEAGGGHFPLTRLARTFMAECAETSGAGALTKGPKVPLDVEGVHEVLAAIDREIAAGKTSLRPLALAVRVEKAIAAAEGETSRAVSVGTFNLRPRLCISRWAIDEGDLAGLIPIRDPRLRILHFDYDVSELVYARTAADFPDTPTRHSTYVIVFCRDENSPRSPLLVDGLTARILELSDGTRTAAEIVDQCKVAEFNDARKWIENLFLSGFVQLQDPGADELPGGVDERERLPNAPSLC